MRDQMTEPREYYDEPEGDGYDWDYEPEDHGPKPKVLWGRVISLVIFMLLAFFLGRSMGGGGDGPTQAEFDDLQAALNAAEASNESLSADIKELNAEIKALQAEGADPGGDTGGDEPEPDAETVAYTVKEGDTLDEIIDKHYGCLSVGNIDLSSEWVIPANTGLDAAALHVGDEILLPPLPDGQSCS